MNQTETNSISVMDQTCIRFLRGLPEFAAVCVTCIAVGKCTFAERILVSSVQTPAAVFIFFAGSFRFILTKDPEKLQN